MIKTLLATVAAIGLVGCVGGIQGPGQSGDDDGKDDTDTPDTGPDSQNPSGSDLTAARKLFDDNVYGILNAKCTGAACHAETSQGATITRFVAIDATKGWEVATGYQALVGNFSYTAAPILTKMAPGHQGMTYTQGEVDKITEWLNKELELRQTGGGTDPGTGSGGGGGETLAQASERVLSEFAGCMSLQNFQTANMAQAWGDLEAQNNTECDNCHATGGNGFLASRDENFFYTYFSTKKYFLLQYVTVDLTGGAAAAKVIVNKSSFMGVANAQDPHREHPRFDCSPNDGCTNDGMTALQEFYDLTMAAKTAGGCAPRALEN
ncbi:MAG: hypothetical protein AB7O24_00435 [Kofleriaceae bacterium]